MTTRTTRIAARYVTPALLVAVASTHLFVGQTQPMNPWVGGGFGMFASVDRRDLRAVRAEAQIGSQRVALDVDGWAQQSEDHAATISRIVALPSPGVLEDLEGQLRSAQWSATGKLADEDAPPVELGDMQISVWKTAYADEGPSARPERIAAHRGEAR